MTYSMLLNRCIKTRFGKEVFRGMVCKVGVDFLEIDDEQTGLVILPLEHLKEIVVELSRPTDMDGTSQSLPPLQPGVLPDDLKDVCSKLQNSVVQLEGGGPGPTVGYLMQVMKDYLILCVVPDGFLYIPTRHVLTIIPLDVNILPEFTDWSEKYLEKHRGNETFTDLLTEHIGQSVRFRCHSKDPVSGVLCKVENAHVEVMTSPFEQTWLPMHHIKSMIALEIAEFRPSPVPNP